MAPATSAAPPATHKQPSRKGKRAWRKNVDLSEIQAGTESARDQVIQTGGQLLADLPASALFQTDTAGSVQIKSKSRKVHPELKVDEILARRSAVPAVSSHKRSGEEAKVTDGVLATSNKRRRGDGVSHAELLRLKGIAYGGDNAQQQLVFVEGVAKHDPWADEVSIPIPETQSYLTSVKQTVKPRTLEQPPISLTATGKAIPHVPQPSAGRSYNPAFADWTALLEREGNKELLAEQKRMEVAAIEAARLERVAAATAEAEREETRDAAASEFEESEWEGIQSEVEDSELRRKRPDRKTPTERNKAKRRKEAERLAKHERKTRERDAQLKQIAAIRRELDSKVAKLNDGTLAGSNFPGSVQSSEEEIPEDEVAEVLRRRKFGKVAVPNAPLELVLADELQESLRLLKPEGNLLRDRYRNMLVQGKIEARRAIFQPKKANRKATEKWSYKDWKL